MPEIINMNGESIFEFKTYEDVIKYLSENSKDNEETE